MKKYDILIIGGGPAGMGAVIQAAHLGLAHLLIERKEPQSRLLLARKVENFPRLRTSGRSGKELHRALWAQALKKGAVFKKVAALSIADNRGTFAIETEKGSFTARTVIIAAGLAPKKLDKNIARPPLENKGLFYRWTDIPFSKHKRQVLVVGGGEVAFDQACSLAEKGFEVTMAIRGRNDKAFGSLRREARALGIAISYDTRIMRLSGTDQGMKVSMIKAGRKMSGQYDHCLAAIGSTRNVPVLSSSARQCLNAGIYLAGDAAHPKIKQAAIAFGDGIKRTMEAYEYIRKSR